MPWILIVLGIAAVVVALVLRADTLVTKRTNETTTTREPLRGGLPERRFQTNVVHKRVVTETAPSDTLLAALLGFAAALVLSGAFYARIGKISGPGGFALELKAEAAKAVERVAPRSAARAPSAPRFDAAAKAAIAIAADEAERIVQLSQIDPEAAKSLPSVRDLESEELKRLTRDGTLPTRLWDRLAEDALSTALGEADTNVPDS